VSTKSKRGCQVCGTALYDDSDPCPVCALRGALGNKQSISESEAPLILRTRKLKVKRERTVNEKKIVKRYNEEFKRQAVELLIHSGKRQAQVARELGVSDYTLTLWKRAYLGQLKPGELEGKPLSPEEMLETIRQLQKENEYLKRQREILKKAMSIVGEEPNPGMR
jgi:transposase